MPRVTQDITDVFHGVLLGITSAYFVWAWLNRHTYGASRLGKMSLLVTVLVCLRLLSSIRLESSSPSACYFWILMRSTISLFGIFSVNIFFQTELFINLAIKTTSHASKMRWRYLIHGVTQLINVVNVIQYLTIMSAFTNGKGFCGLDERDVVPLTVLTILSFGICLIQNVAVLLSNSTFTAMTQVARLFRITTISTVLLCVWVVYIHLDSLYLEWADWKSVYFTVMLVWMSCNSLLASNFLVSLRIKSQRDTTQVSAVSTASRTATGVPNHRASVVSAKGAQSENGSNSSAAPIKASAMVHSSSMKNFPPTE
ncbi:hypothetical protein H9P43_005731 [Blastocladiella emersonii ATCC 22665]|nr:hypothetical protein H9P43_005731 [Blastocladiella emersonii ATCC 22665]